MIFLYQRQSCSEMSSDDGDCGFAALQNLRNI